MNYKINITQSIYEPYTNKDGEKVDYARKETIEGEATDFEMITSLTNIITTMFKNIEVVISVDNKNKEEH